MIDIYRMPPKMRELVGEHRQKTFGHYSVTAFQDSQTTYNQIVDYKEFLTNIRNNLSKFRDYDTTYVKSKGLVLQELIEKQIKTVENSRHEYWLLLNGEAAWEWFEREYLGISPSRDYSQDKTGE